MTERWIKDQTEYLVSQWDNAIESHYPQHLKTWRDPHANFEAVNNEWNLLRAVEAIDWQRFIVPRCRILDLGSGTGWLSAYLSKMANVGLIYSLDSSDYFLEKMMPALFELMQGDISKVTKINGLFAPLLLESDAVDIVVASSSLHHSGDLQAVLTEVSRVLSADGLLFVLNETPDSAIRYVTAITKQFLRILADTVMRRYKNISAQISSSGYLYDPFLGDKRFSLWQWRSALEQAGFSVDLMETDFYTNKRDAKGPKLTHFICKKISLEMKS